MSLHVQARVSTSNLPLPNAEAVPLAQAAQPASSAVVTTPERHRMLIALGTIGAKVGAAWSNAPGLAWAGATALYGGVAVAVTTLHCDTATASAALAPFLAGFAATAMNYIDGGNGFSLPFTAKAATAAIRLIDDNLALALENNDAALAHKSGQRLKELASTLASAVRTVDPVVAAQASDAARELRPIIAELEAVAASQAEH